MNKYYSTDVTIIIIMINYIIILRQFLIINVQN